MERSNVVNQRKKELQKDNFIFHDAIHLAIEAAEASSGRFPTETQYNLLHQAGYIAYPASEVCRIFYDWGDYHQIAHTFYEDFLNEKQEKQNHILETMESEREAGILPGQLFKNKESYHEVDQSGEPVKGKRSLRYRLTEDDAPVNLQIERYTKYKVLEYLLENDPDRNITDENKLGIVLGFTLSTGKAKTSFVGSIQSGKPYVSSGDIENAAELLGFYEFVFPRHRRDYLKELSEVGQLNDHGSPSVRSYFDKIGGKLLIGDVAKREYLQENPSAKKNVEHLGRLLLAKEVEVKFGRRGQFKDWEKEQYLRYGKWLVKVLHLYDETLSVDVLKRGYELGIGPHPDRLRQHYNGSVVTYFQELTVALGTYVGDNRRAVFKDWDFEDYVEHIKKVASENDGVVTKKLLFERIKRGALEPSPYMIEKKYGMNELLEAAGLPTFSKTYSPDKCIRMGVRFARDNNGKTPSEVDMQRTDYLMSEYLVRKYFGKVSTYRKIVQHALRD